MKTRTIDVLDDNGEVVSSTRVNPVRTTPVSTFNIFDSYKSIASTSKTITNEDKFEFNERFADILSEAIVRDNRYLLSPEQKAIVDRYFSLAPDSVEGLTTSEVDVEEALGSEDLIQLDNYLGGV